MKADEYVQRWRELEARRGENEGVDGTIAKILEAMFLEIREIMKARQAGTDKALAAIVREQYQKWCAFVDRVSDDLPDGIGHDTFREVFLGFFPEVEGMAHLVWPSKHQEPSSAARVR